MISNSSNQDHNGSDSQDQGKAKKVAVIAVHGVSDQQPFDSAKQIANLLINPEFQHSYRYTSFIKKFIKIPVKHINHKSCNKQGHSIIPDERGEFIHERLQKDINEDETTQVDIDIDLTRDYLSEYRQSTVFNSIRLEGEVIESYYQKKVHIYEMYWADLSRLGTGFIRIFGELYQLLFHIISLGRPVVDLARLSIREELNSNFNEEQNLNPETIKQRKKVNQRIDYIIKCWGRLQIWDGRILTMVIPILNIFLLITLFLTIPINNLSSIFLPYLNYICLIIIITTLVYLIFNFVIKTKKIYSFRVRFYLPILLLFSFGLLIPYLQNKFFEIFLSQNIYISITLEWAIILILIVYIFIIRPYNRHRPGTIIFAGTIFLILIFLYLCLYGLPSSYLIEDITFISLNLVELIYILIFFAWIIFTALYLITSLIGFLIGCCLRTKISPVNFQKFAQARRISILSLSFPGLLFLMLTLSLWSALNQIGSHLIMSIDYVPKYMKGLCSFIHAIPWSLAEDVIEKYRGEILNAYILSKLKHDIETYFHDNSLKLPDVSDILTSYKGDIINEKNIVQIGEKLGQTCSSESDCFLQVVSDFSATPFAIIFILIFIFTLLIALWTLLPAILTEIFPPNSNNENNNNNYLSFDLGQWLTNGFGFTIFSIDFLIAILTPILFFFALLLGFNYLLGLNSIGQKYLSDWLEITTTIQSYSAVLIAASAGSLVAFGSRLNKISLGLREVLDAALDVDNYLRLYPRDDNPRARIYARYFSLLRYICKWQDPIDGKKYDEIVIISHSQGTVISADILRFLQYCDNNSDLVSMLGVIKCKIPHISLFTMGSPIRQLYSFAFPHLYHWVYNSKSISDITNTTPILPDKINPDPSELLGVKQWVNAYRSGDYIGRYLWRSPEDRSLWNKVDFENSSSSLSEDQAKMRREFCIGAGGHTHYWDETAPEIAYELDRLIREA